MRRKGLSVKLIILLLLSSLLPLFLFGIISIWTARQFAYKAITEGNLGVALRAADQVDLYVNNAINILKGLSNNLNKTRMTIKQRSIIIKNYVNNFNQFESIYITDSKGMQVVRSNLNTSSTDKSTDPAFLLTSKGETYRSEVYFSENNEVPEMIIALPIMTFNIFNGMAVARINLLDIWKLVDNLKIGEEGIAFVVCKKGFLVAHWDKAKILKQENLRDMRVVSETLAGKSSMDIYRNNEDVKVLAVSAAIKSLGWGMFLEQPISEAYAPAYILSYQLAIMIIVFMILIASIGYLGGKKYILNPIFEIIDVSKEISLGKFETKVNIRTQDEFSVLGDSFNYMTDRLIELQDNIRRKEREALLGKIAGGLIHDLRHPIGNIEMSSKLIQKMYHDVHYRNTFKVVVEREFKNINQFLDNLSNLTQPKELFFIEIDLNRLIPEIIESLEGKIKEAGILLTTDFYAGELHVSGDYFSLSRVFNNIIVNAIQSIEEKMTKNKNAEHLEKKIKITTLQNQEELKIIVNIEDTGIGIAAEKIHGIFDDYMTTKRKGIGLGLAICNKSINKHNGNITVESTVGQSAKFSIIIPKISYT